MIDSILQGLNTKLFLHDRQESSDADLFISKLDNEFSIPAITIARFSSCAVLCGECTSWRGGGEGGPSHPTWRKEGERGVPEMARRIEEEFFTRKASTLKQPNMAEGEAKRIPEMARTRKEEFHL